MSPRLLALYVDAWKKYNATLVALAFSAEPWRHGTPQEVAARDALARLGGIEALCLEAGITMGQMQAAVYADMEKKP